VSGHLYARAGNVVLIIETNAPGSNVMLYTFAADGHIWDNWFPDMNIAKENAAANVSGFSDADWEPVPTGVSDLMDFGKSLRQKADWDNTGPRR
jgi:hypothetical protein